MAILANPKQEAFCQLRVQGRTLDEAYKLAGYKPSRQHAQRLATKGTVEARIAELRKAMAETFEITAESIAAQLDADWVFARACKVPSAAVAATVAKGKLAGLFTEKSSVHVTHSYQTMTDEELRFEMAALAAEARSIKPGVQH